MYTPIIINNPFDCPIKSVEVTDRKLIIHPKDPTQSSHAMTLVTPCNQSIATLINEQGNIQIVRVDCKEEGHENLPVLFVSNEDLEKIVCGVRSYIKDITLIESPYIKLLSPSYDCVVEIGEVTKYQNELYHTKYLYHISKVHATVYVGVKGNTKGYTTADYLHLQTRFDGKHILLGSGLTSIPVKKVSEKNYTHLPASALQIKLISDLKGYRTYANSSTTTASSVEGKGGTQ